MKSVLKIKSIKSIIIHCFFYLSYSTHSYAIIGKVRDVRPDDGLSSIANVNGATGVLIRSNIILTAGHNIQFGYIEKNELKVTFPESKNPTKIFFVKKLKTVTKGLFPTRYLDHSGQDLALLLLSESPSKLLSIQPLSLYNKVGNYLKGKKVTIAGYGRYSMDQSGRCIGAGSVNLKVASSQILELLAEPGRWGAPLIIGTPDVSPCDGDSGSPALIEISGKKYIVGIASGPYLSTSTKHLGRSFQYVDIGSALNWIKLSVDELKR